MLLQVSEGRFQRAENPLHFLSDLNQSRASRTVSEYVRLRKADVKGKLDILMFFAIARNREYRSTLLKCQGPLRVRQWPPRA